MRIVLTGGSGFLGRALAGRLKAAGHELVLPLRHPSPESIAIPPIDAMDSADWAPILAGADAVVHAAAIAHIGPSVPEAAYRAVNRDASQRLAQAAAAAGVSRFVFVSSIRAQVGAASAERQDEQIPPRPTEAYGRSKLEAEQLIREAMPLATILRPALIIGPESKGNLGLLLRLARLPVPLPFGALTAPQAMVSLDAVCQAVMMALEDARMAGETYCVAQDPPMSLAAMLAALRRGLRRPPGLFALPGPLLALALKLAGRAGIAERLTDGLAVDSSKLAALGWKPAQALEDVLEEVGAQARRA